MSEIADKLSACVSNTSLTATERLLDVSNAIWDAMYKSGEVPTYGERAYFHLALKDVMDENTMLRAERNHMWALRDTWQENDAKLRELVRDMWDFFCVLPDDPCTSKEELDFSIEVWKRMRDLGIEVGE